MSPGNRVKKIEEGTVSYYVSDDYDIEDNVETVYYFANDNRVSKKSAEGQFWYLDDHLGSTSVMIDEEGELVERTLYYPFGSYREGGEAEKYTFTGKEFDSEIGLYYYGARYYNPETFVFTQADSIIPDVYNPQALNRYSYCLNNPLKYTDPSGNSPILLPMLFIQGASIECMNQYFRYGEVNNWKAVAQYGAFYTVKTSVTVGSIAAVGGATLAAPTGVGAILTGAIVGTVVAPFSYLTIGTAESLIYGKDPHETITGNGLLNAITIEAVSGAVGGAVGEGIGVPVAKAYGTEAGLIAGNAASAATSIGASNSLGGVSVSQSLNKNFGEPAHNTLNNLSNSLKSGWEPVKQSVNNGIDSLKKKLNIK
ncbi:RHS repeat-associated core domain-containing protein [Methanolapillus ohkumae]